MSNIRNNIEELLSLLRSGKIYREDIYEGQIVYLYENGKYYDRSWQNNPYGGEGIERNNELAEEETINILTKIGYDYAFQKLNY
ncbi:MAG: hypothetical protein NZ529_01570 [Cytophagaceae bacterium]|nr:hypothetical protein [Cytophagaceae bacterium]MDW8455455.1 hypothetical protein [Cytophagaceae bacterium]